MRNQEAEPAVADFPAAAYSMAAASVLNDDNNTSSSSLPSSELLEQDMLRMVLAKNSDFDETIVSSTASSLVDDTEEMMIIMPSEDDVAVNDDDDSKNKPANSSTSTSAKQKRAMELNEAYEALEQMRRLNLEVICQECGVPPNQIDYEECSACLLEGILAARNESRYGKVSKFMRPKSHKVPDSLGKLKQMVEKEEERRKPKQCLTCGAPSCRRRHSSAAFQKEGITVCKQCEAVFQMETLSDILTSDNKQELLDQMMDLYDRCMLLLKFSHPYFDDYVQELQSSKNRDNKIQFGGSSVGIVSGILGVAAAVTIVTPVGVPLLIVSLMLGGAATSAQTGTELNAKFFSQPNQFANRILALHGMVRSVKTILLYLQMIVNRDQQHMHLCMDDNNHLTQNVSFEQEENEEENGNNDPPSKQSPGSFRFKKRPPKVVMGRTAATGGVALAGTRLVLPVKGASVARGARHYLRGTSGALRSLRFAQVAGGVLAGVTIALEAKNMAITILAIRDGSPCDKANALKNIKEELSELPETHELDQECSTYLAYFDQRGLDKEEAMELLIEAIKEAAAAEEEEKKAKVSSSLNTENKMPSFRQRIEQFKKSDNSSRTNNNSIGTNCAADEQENGGDNYEGDSSPSLEPNSLSSSLEPTVSNNKLTSSVRQRIQRFKQNNNSRKMNKLREEIESGLAGDYEMTTSTMNKHGSNKNKPASIRERMEQFKNHRISKNNVASQQQSTATIVLDESVIHNNDNTVVQDQEQDDDGDASSSVVDTTPSSSNQFLMEQQFQKSQQKRRQEDDDNNDDNSDSSSLSSERRIVSSGLMQQVQQFKENRTKNKKINATSEQQHPETDALMDHNHDTIIPSSSSNPLMKRIQQMKSQRVINKQQQSNVNKNNNSDSTNKSLPLGQRWKNRQLRLSGAGSVANGPPQSGQVLQSNAPLSFERSACSTFEESSSSEKSQEIHFQSIYSQVQEARNPNRNGESLLFQTDTSPIINRNVTTISCTNNDDDESQSISWDVDGIHPSP